MKRASYREAIRWLTVNDDTEWMLDDEPIISVTAALVADLFDVPQERVIADLRKALESAMDEAVNRGWLIG